LAANSFLSEELTAFQLCAIMMIAPMIEAGKMERIQYDVFEAAR
jgi:hypothetical protein